MKFATYIQSLFPSFSRKRILKDIDALREELVKNTLPPFQTVISDMGSKPLKSAFNRKFEISFKKDFSGRYKGNYLTGVNDTLLTVESNLDGMYRMAEAKIEQDVVRDALALSTANIMQWIETASFATRYGRRLFLMATGTEANLANGVDEFEGFVQSEVDYINQNRDAFIQAMSILTIKKGELEKVIDDLPAITLTKDNVEYLTSTIGSAKMDPLQFGYIPGVSWIPYHLGIALAEYQVARFNAAVDEKRMLEFRLMQLKQQAAGRSDARLEQQIEYMSGRLQTHNFKIAKMEESHGLA